MRQYQIWENPVSLSEYVRGTFLFNKLVLSDRRTYLWMLRAFTRTICGRVSHVILNDQQEMRFPNAPVIASFAPGFQLDAQAYPNMIKAFNTQGVPVFTSPSLPQGLQAFLHNRHPDTLVEALSDFTIQLAQTRPQTTIMAIGHSYWAAQQAHAWSILDSRIQKRVVPVTYQGMLRNVWVMACALPHSPLYPIPRDVFRWKDQFLLHAYNIMYSNPNALFGFDPHDGYMKQVSQLDNIPLDDPRVITLDTQESPWHYGDSFLFAQDFASKVLASIQKQ